MVYDDDPRSELSFQKQNIPIQKDNDALRMKFNTDVHQVWKFCPESGTPKELSKVEMARQSFRDNRFHKKHSSDLLMRIQFAEEKQSVTNLPQTKLEEFEDVKEEAIMTTLHSALDYYSTIQADDGHWPGDYGGHMFLLPGLWKNQSIILSLFITLYVTGALNTVLSKEHQYEICRYLYNYQASNVHCVCLRFYDIHLLNRYYLFVFLQNRDGGWGLHIEGPSTMFGTVLNYVSLRLLGEGAEGGERAIEKARKWILEHGRMWCHCRMVHLPMSFLYGKKFVGPITPTILS
ncbi:hypothetical protein E1A91_D04G140900v1 [Gossypium mustelinum]|uniref:Squalene cyclase N-terminal domain-containing protein n=1 Tax=Gossypium mustelinum TaxID=34275 RepID=A0A5D2VDR2_GOSMU|nr:hypothetical protein E1A91_D04G140900v1 [Gossypium mustelinum]